MASVPEAAMPDETEKLGEQARIVLSSIALIVSNLLVAILAVATVHIQAQNLGAVRFGRFTTIVAFISTFALLADLGVNTVTARDVAKDWERASTIISSAFVFRMLLCLVTAPLLVVGALLLYPGQKGTIGVGVAIMSLDLFFTSAQAVTQTYYSGRIRNDIPSLLLVINKLLYFVGVIVVAATGHSILEFLIAYAAADGVLAVVSVVLVHRRVRLKVVFEPRAWGRLAAVSLSIGATQLVDRIYSRLDSVLLSLLKTAPDVAHYGIAFNFADALSNIPAYIMTSAMPALVRTTSREETARKMQVIVDAVVWLGAPLAAGGYELRGEIVTLVAGPGYGASVTPMALLIITIAISFPQVALVWGCLAIDQYRLLLPSVIVTTLVNVGLNLLLIPGHGPTGSAMAQMATEVLSLMMTFAIFRVRSGARIRLRRSLLSVAVAAAAVPASWPLEGAWHGLPTLVAPFVGTAVIGALWFALSVLAGTVPGPAVSMVPGQALRRWLAAANGGVPRAVASAARRLASGR